MGKTSDLSVQLVLFRADLLMNGQQRLDNRRKPMSINDQLPDNTPEL
jgi:hypothetical protein